jgi:hypothetical protein
MPVDISFSPSLKHELDKIKEVIEGDRHIYCKFMMSDFSELQVGFCGEQFL